MGSASQLPWASLFLFRRARVSGTLLSPEVGSDADTFWHQPVDEALTAEQTHVGGSGPGPPGGDCRGGVPSKQAPVSPFLGPQSTGFDWGLALEKLPMGHQLLR